MGSLQEEILLEVLQCLNSKEARKILIESYEIFLKQY